MLAPSGETQIVVNIDERNLGKLALGQNAFASADAFPDDRFAAELFYVNPGIDPIRGAVQVKLRVPHPPPYLRQDVTLGMRGDAAVEITAGLAAGDAIVPATNMRVTSGQHVRPVRLAAGRTP